MGKSLMQTCCFHRWSGIGGRVEQPYSGADRINVQVAEPVRHPGERAT
jgi:hypothetical protein